MNLAALRLGRRADQVMGDAVKIQRTTYSRPAITELPNEIVVAPAIADLHTEPRYEQAELHTGVVVGPSHVPQIDHPAPRNPAGRERTLQGLQLLHNQIR